MARALVILVDIADQAVMAAARQGLQQFGSGLCLQQQRQAPPAAGAAAPAPRFVLGLCNLAKPPQSLKPVLQVRHRPGPFALRDFCSAVGRLQHAGGDSAEPISGATAAAALQQLVAVVAQDAACTATGPGRTAVLYLTDRVNYEADDFRPCLEVCRGKGVQMDFVFLSTEPDAAASSGLAAGDGSMPSSMLAALAAGWAAAEAAFPHLSVTIVQSASQLSLEALAGALLQRYGSTHLSALEVNLQFKQPLLGSIRSLALICTQEVQPLRQAVDHAALCPCHRTPTAWSAAMPTCAVSGAPLDLRHCGRDERTVQIGSGPAGALHMSAPFNIASSVGGGSGGAATPLNVVARLKADQANPALLFGTPLMLAASSAPHPSQGQAVQGQGQAVQGQGQQRYKVVLPEGQVADISQGQLLELVCGSLSDSGEALLATCTTDLECGRAGLFRLHYLLLPCPVYGGGSSSGSGAAASPPPPPPAAPTGSGGGSGSTSSTSSTTSVPLPPRPAMLCAKRVACAEELLPPLLAPPLAAAELAVPVQALPPAVAEAVGSQLARVPLADRLDPLALHSRCNETIQMLVRESQTLPKPQAPPAPAGAAQALAPAPMHPAGTLGMQAPDAANPPLQGGLQAGPANAPRAAARGRRAAAAAIGGGGGAANAVRQSGGTRQGAAAQLAAGKQQQGSKGLQLKPVRRK